VGPTASGKSALAVELARRLGDVELVSVDSMAVYRGMDVGTAKPSAAERAELRYHCLDLVDPSEEFSVSRYQREARAALEGIERRGHRAVLVGGTGLYLRAALEPLSIPGRFPDVARALEAEADEPLRVVALHRWLSRLDPLAASRIEPTNRRRVIRALEVTLGSGRPFSSYGPGLTCYPPLPGVLIVGLRPSPETLARNVATRVDHQLAAGWLEEVRGLAARPAGLSRTARQAIGYRELLAYLAGELDLATARAEIVRRSLALARRQLRWFRRDPRVVFVDPELDGWRAIERLVGSWWACSA
jgi:tRNA dimethylallyltransferase